MRVVYRGTPLVNALSKGTQIKATMGCWVGREVPPRPLQHGATAKLVSARIMNEGHRNLDQPLQKLALRLRSVTPDILQNLMRFKELGGVEEGDAALHVGGLRHASVSHERGVRS